MEEFCKPDPLIVKGAKSSKYNKIDEDGLAKVGARVTGGDIIVGKTVALQDIELDEEQIASKYTHKDVSMGVRPSESGIVDQVMISTTPEGKRFTKIRMRSVRIPEQGDKIACLLPECLVLTSTGWKQIKDVKSEDKVCILDPSSDSIRYEHPLHLHKYDYEGNMYHLKSNNVNKITTPNHRMWIKDDNTFHFEEAQNIFGKKVEYKQTISNYTPTDCITTFSSAEGATNPFGPFDILDWIKLFIIFIYSGCVCNPINQTPHIIFHFSIGLKILLKKMNIPFEETEESIFINDCDIIKELLFSEEGLPEWIWKLNYENARLLMRGLIYTFNDDSESSPTVYTTSYEKLALDISRLGIHSGYNVRIDNINSEYRVYTPGALGPVIQDSTESYYEEEWKWYKGSVYCLSVSTEIFMIQTDGKSVFTGNSTHGQKGTVGLLMQDVDLPFTQMGITPEILLNPHCVPSRMTIAQLLECVVGKANLIDGHIADGTPFENRDFEKDYDRLQSYGFQRHGNEVMFNGRTGEKMDAKIFLGPVYYQRLKHLVADKQHCLTMDHQVLTDDGWKSFEELSTSSRVATLSGSTIEYNTPDKIHHYPDFKGYVYHIINEFINTIVTFNHRVYVKIEKDYQLIEIGDLFQMMKERSCSVLMKNDECEFRVCEKDISLHWIEQPVFCLSVKNEIFMTRRNTGDDFGLSVWTGNSRSYGPLQNLVRQPTEGRSREGGLRLIASLSGFFKKNTLNFFRKILLVRV